MFEDLSVIQIIIYIAAGLGILFSLLRIIDILRERRYQRELTEFALFCELIFFQMRLSISDEFLRNKIYHIKGQLVLYNYLAFTKEFIKFFTSLADNNDINEQAKSNLLSIPLLDIDIVGELEKGYKIRLYIKRITSDKKTDFIEYNSENNIVKILLDNSPIEMDFRSKCKLVHAFYKIILHMFKTPVNKMCFDVTTFKETKFKAGDMLNLVKMNGTLLYKFSPVLSKDDIEELNKKRTDDAKLSKGFDNI